MTYASTVLADAPLAYYQCQETSGTVLSDASGHGNNGTIAGGAIVNDSTDAAAPTSLGSHIRLDGTTGYLDLASSVNWLDVTNGFTAEGWFYVRSVANWQRFFVFATTAESNANDIAMGRWSTTGDIFVNVNSATNWDVANKYPTLNAWHHIALTITNAGAATVYVDGASVGTSTVNIPAVVARSMKWIARSQYSADAYNPTSVTQVAVYGTALTATRVQAHYTAGTAAPAAPSGTLAAVTPRSAATLAGSYAGPPAPSGTLAGVTPPTTASLAGSYLSTATGSLAATAPRATAGLSGSYAGATGTNTANLLNGRDRQAIGYVTITIPDAPVPGHLILGDHVDKTRPLPTPTMVNGRPT